MTIMKRLLLAVLMAVLALPASSDVTRSPGAVGTVQSPNFTGTATLVNATLTGTLSVPTITATTSATIGGSSPTAITNIRVYSASCTPTASSAAIQTHTFACTVNGLTVADKVIVNPPSNTSLCPLVNARVSGADTLSLAFSVLTAAICTPAAGTYAVVAIRS